MLMIINKKDKKVIVRKLFNSYFIKNRFHVIQWNLLSEKTIFNCGIKSHF